MRGGELGVPVTSGDARALGDLADGAAEPGRRHLLALAGAGLLTATLAACGSSSSPKAAATTAAVKTGGDRNDAKTLTWKTARKRLEDGNRRFSEGRPTRPDQSAVRRKRLVSGQKPFAAVLCCADSRVPPELLFDQGLGDLFVVRSAGQVLDHAVVGSLQYALAELKVPLMVVLGHSKCGAVTAAVEVVQNKGKATGTDIDTLVTAIRPAVTQAITMGAKGEDVLPVAVDNNVERVIAQLGEVGTLATAAKAGRLKITGGTYDLATGEVTFL